MKELAQEVELNLIKRVLSACAREKILSYAVNDNELKFQLANSKTHIIAKQVKFNSLNNLKFQGDILINDQEGSRQLTSIATLLDILASEVAAYTSPECYSQFVSEIFNCFENAILTSQQAAKINSILAQQFSNYSQHNFIQFIADNYDVHEQVAFFERWTTNGHPLHPCYRTKFGLSEDEYQKYCPEFNQDIPLQVLALAKSLVHEEAIATASNYSAWFAQKFSRQYQLWQTAMAQQSLAVAEFYPLFVHPWQYENTILSRFKDLIASRQLLLFPEITLTAQSTMSFRTFISKESHAHPHIKLPVAVQSTSALRTISPASVQNGPKLSHILQQILASQNYFLQSLKIASEVFGLHLKEETNIAKHLGILYRENIATLVEPGNLPIVVAALFQEIPGTKVCLLKNIIENALALNNYSVLDYFSLYADTVINAFFELFLIYGIALEGHQQNSLMVFDANYRPHNLIVRDLGGVKIDVDLLASHGYAFKPYPASSIIAQAPLDLVNTFLHTVVQLHLGGVISVVADEYGIEEGQLWQMIKNKILRQFNLLQPKANQDHWQAAYFAILESEVWQVKGLLRMRLCDTAADYVFVELDNPLRVNDAS